MKKIMFIIFQIANIIFFIVRYFFTFFRPFMKPHLKLKTAWIGQTIIYFHLLSFSGLTPGAFGWTIDQGQEGMIKSMRHMFFFKSVIEVTAAQPFIVYKFVQNDIAPVLIQEMPLEIFLMVLFTVLVFFAKLLKGGVKESKILVICREIKSCLYIFNFVPFALHFVHNLFSVSYSKFLDFW